MAKFLVDENNPLRSRVSFEYSEAQTMLRAFELSSSGDYARVWTDRATPGEANWVVIDFPIYSVQAGLSPDHEVCLQFACDDIARTFEVTARSTEFFLALGKALEDNRHKREPIILNIPMAEWKSGDIIVTAKRNLYHVRGGFAIQHRDGFVHSSFNTDLRYTARASLSLDGVLEILEGLNKAADARAFSDMKITDTGIRVGATFVETEAFGNVTSRMTTGGLIARLMVISEAMQTTRSDTLEIMAGIGYTAMRISEENFIMEIDSQRIFTGAGIGTTGMTNHATQSWKP